MAHVTLLIVISSIVIPVLLTLGLVLSYRKWQAEMGRRSPIEGRVIYRPGEQLRNRGDDHGDEIMGSMAVMFFLANCTGRGLKNSRIDYSGFGNSLPRRDHGKEMTKNSTLS